jgi:hypothetical protein
VLVVKKVYETAIRKIFVGQAVLLGLVAAKPVTPEVKTNCDLISLIYDSARYVDRNIFAFNVTGI